MFRLLGLFISCFAVAFAQTSQPDACANANTQAEMDQCSAKQAQAADETLNKLYQCVVKNQSGVARTKLKNAERLWVQYRDAHCTAVGSKYEGGSIRPMIESECRAEITNQRIASLHKGYSGGNPDQAGPCAALK